MKRNLFAIFMAGCLITACYCTPKTTIFLPETAKLAGTWELNYIIEPKIAFKDLYPQQKPTITFDAVNTMVSGNTSCNSFSGKFKVDGNTIDFTGPLAMTRKMCAEGADGERVFTEMLPKVNTYTITNDTTLNFIMGDLPIMQFAKK
jgi:heat shock protein HslJ